MAKVLIVDDQAHILDALGLLFEMRGGLEVLRAQSVAEALEQVRSGQVSVVVQDMNYSEGTTSGAEGKALFEAIRRIDPMMPVVLMTAWASLELAVELVKSGADDYLEKPWNDEQLLRKVQNLYRAREQGAVQLGAQQQADALQPAGRAPQQGGASSSPRLPLERCGLLFESAPMHALLSLAGKVAPSRLPVLVTGPNGSGKEKLAEILHANSALREEAFIKVNVGALPDELFAAELFGAERGAFTGATARRIGRFEAADGGTLFLDEMGNLSLESQAKLLRALQTGEFERLGSSQTRKAHVRIIAATNLDMAEAIRLGHFREDLFYRLAAIELKVPPLAERQEDIPLLARAFAEAYHKELSGSASAKAASALAFSPEFLEALRIHSWPGNVRELQNRVQRALLMAEGGPLLPEHLGIEALAAESAALVEPQEALARGAVGGASTVGAPEAFSPAAPELASSVASAPTANSTTASRDTVTPEALSSVGEGEGVRLSPLEVAERQTIEQALAANQHVVSRAAAALGLSRQSLYRRMQRLELKLKRELTSG